MAGEIYLSNLSGQFDYQSILQKYQQLKFQQVSVLQNQEETIKKQKSAFKSFADLLDSFKKDFEALTSSDIFDKKSIQNSDENVASVAINDESKVTAGSLEFSVKQLAKKDVWLSQSGVANRTDTVASSDGTLSISVGSQNVDIAYSATDTLDDIANKINQASNKLNASIFFDGTNYRLIVSSKQTGTDNALSFSDTGDLLSTLKLGGSGDGSHVQQAQNAQIDIYGQTVESQTNTFSNVLDGIDIKVKQVSANPVHVAITDDEKAAQDGIEKLFSAYNSLVDYVQQSTGEKGDLSGDYALQSIRSSILSKLTPFMERGLISVDHTNGHISLKSDQFDTLYKTNKQELKNTLSEVKNSLDPYLTFLFDPEGTIKQKEKAYDRKINRYEDRISSIVKRIDLETENLKKQFIHLDSLMARMNDIKLRVSALLPKQKQQ